MSEKQSLRNEERARRRELYGRAIREQEEADFSRDMLEAEQAEIKQQAEDLLNDALAPRIMPAEDEWRPFDGFGSLSA